MVLDTARRWLAAPVTQPGRAVAFVRIAVALILLTHPVHALLHPEGAAKVGQLLALRGLPASAALAWAALGIQLLCSIALLVNRLVAVACLGHIAVLAGGIGLIHAPLWFVVGGAREEGHPGVEFNLLLMACLVGVLWCQGLRSSTAATTDAREAAARRGLDIIRLAAAALLIIHPIHGLLDPEGLRGFGEELQDLGYPHGVVLVWILMFVQVSACLALVARRAVVPACLAHIFVLSMGIRIAHAPRWFVVGPGENGMEYSLLFISCFVALLWAHWPRQEPAFRVRPVHRGH